MVIRKTMAFLQNYFIETPDERCKLYSERFKSILSFICYQKSWLLMVCVSQRLVTQVERSFNDISYNVELLAVNIYV